MLHPDDLATIVDALEDERIRYTRMVDLYTNLEQTKQITQGEVAILEKAQLKLAAIEATLTRVRALAVAAQDATPAQVDEGELLPCPFCGGTAFVEQMFPSEPHLQLFAAGCQNDCATFQYIDTEAKAIAAWNRRAQPAPPQVTIPLGGNTETPEGNLASAQGSIVQPAPPQGELPAPDGPGNQSTSL